MIHNSRIAHSERLSVGANPARKVGASGAKFVPPGLQVGVGHEGHLHQIDLPAKMVASDHTFMRERD
jgi:hypothetical protein